MSSEQCRQVMVALGAVVLLVVGCTKSAIPVTASFTAPIEPAAETPDPTAVDADQRAKIKTSGQHRTVLRVSDGDTIVVLPGIEDRDRIRPLTIDAPELYPRDGSPPKCGADVARAALSGLLPVGTDVILKGLPGEDETDRYDRTLANIYVERDGQLVNVSLWLSKQGWARTLRSYPTVETDQAEALVEQAQAAHRGIWASCRLSTAFPAISE